MKFVYMAIYTQRHKLLCILCHSRLPVR